MRIGGQLDANSLSYLSIIYTFNIKELQAFRSICGESLAAWTNCRAQFNPVVGNLNTIIDVVPGDIPGAGAIIAGGGIPDCAFWNGDARKAVEGRFGTRGFAPQAQLGLYGSRD